MKRAVLAALTLFLLCSPAAARDAALESGRGWAGSFLRGETGALWAAMTGTMRQAIGTPEALARLHQDVGSRYGEERDVLSEEIHRLREVEVYERVSDWSASDRPLLLRIALDRDGRIAGFRVQPAPVAAGSRHLDYDTKAGLRLPFDGAWTVYWGGRTVAENRHAVDPAQRFALDFVVTRDGRSHDGDPHALDSYHCWDRPILAPAAGRVAAALDGLPDQAIGSSDPGSPAGNHVVIDFGDGEFGFLAHLRQGSVAVSRGDRVARGQQVGRCGNSGNSSEPHLHFHLQDGPRLGNGEGLPAQFVAYLADGTRRTNAEPVRGETVAPVQ